MTTSSTTSTTPGPTLPPDEICPSEGYFRAPGSDCSKFYICVAGSDGWIIHHQQCAQGTIFDPSNQSCAWPENVEDTEGCDLP